MQILKNGSFTLPKAVCIKLGVKYTIALLTIIRSAILK